MNQFEVELMTQNQSGFYMEAYTLKEYMLKQLAILKNRF